ncbi:hypothetical protein IAQ67_14890 [Paenibacillus peoriae]|uniref:Uncharacterized protein n=1 Tax=Paenibacillus peoriae TaxID=59893 RepID=A0A7H0Y293_9BACL|nr:hypothetical protein [Paenibacillus peoriae]QNR65201.1 hypothetical protein IAQ67_14890 [Paenibacillus peoriae]
MKGNGQAPKKIGTSKRLSITLPDENWECIDGLIASGWVAFYAENSRDLDDSSLTKEEASKKCIGYLKTARE